MPSATARAGRSACLSPPGPFSAMQTSPVRRRVSDDIGARALLSSLPKAGWLLGDRGYDAGGFREALKDKGARLYPRSKAAQEACEIRQTPLQAAQPYRDHVRQAQGLEARRNTLRQVPRGIPVSNRPRGVSHLLVMNPAPNHGICLRGIRPLALMGSANQVPFGLAGKDARDIRRGVLIVAADRCTIISQVLLTRVSQLGSDSPWRIRLFPCQNSPDVNRPGFAGG